MTKLSIITINYNNLKGLKKTIASVLNQTFANYEYIIIDGGSTDGSAEEIKSVSDKLTYWVSEPDKGVYHAMNKGIKKATGEYCLFLNSGDCLISNEILDKIFISNPAEDIVYGDVQLGNHQYSYPAHPSLDFLLTKSLCHQSTLLKRRLFDQFGLYNENYKVYSDWEFLINVLLVQNCSYQYLSNLCISIMELGGISQQWKNIETRRSERSLILKSYLGRIFEAGIKDQKFIEELNSIFIKYTQFGDSALVRLSVKIENSALFYTVKRIYYWLRK